MERSARVLPIAILASLLTLPLVGARAAAQTGTAAQNPPAAGEVPENAAAQIHGVTPGQAAAGSQATLTITGADFSPGAYVSFSTPDVHVVSTYRVSATELETAIAVRGGATPQTVTLYVSNPAGAVANVTFQIVSASGAAPAPCAPTSEFSKGENPACAVSISSVNPQKAGLSSEFTMKIYGNNFASGAQASFSNPGIHVASTEVVSPTELDVKIQIAPDTAPGVAGLFVRNPNGGEAESTFEVTGSPGAPPAPAAPPSAPAAPPSAPAAAPAAAAQPSAGAEQKFEVYNLGDAATIFKNPSKSQGTLIVADGKLRYEEAGKVVFDVGAAEIQEIAANAILGVDTGTFHVSLKSSKTYNFVSTSLRPADTQKILDALHHALK
jgi:hypothetical protein